MITFKNLSIQCTLADTEGTRTSDLPVIFQYYDWTNKIWVDLFETALSNRGILDLRRAMRPGLPTEEVFFFNAIANEKMPPIRLIPAETSEALSTQPILASTFSFRLIPETETFEIDFGGLFLIPEGLILDGNGRFSDFTIVTSPFKVTVPTDNTPLPVNELYTNLVSEIATASEASDSPFKLSNISLKLKALVQRDGETVNASLLDLDNSRLVNGNAISELVFDITPVQQTETASNKIPDLTGLTETAVRRVLKALGLRLNPVYQKNLAVVNGDSFKQLPAAEETIQPNQLVTVIFSKHE